MAHKFFTLVTSVLLGCASPALAGTFTVVVTNDDGRPVENAVVTLVHEGGGTPIASRQLDAEKRIDQRNETFLPLVTIIPRGGKVLFTNNDSTRHQVYSFSSIKQFEVTLARNETSTPVAFDKAGVAALGCNIHDHMIAYAFVTDSPWTVLTGADGRTAFPDMPPGNYEVRLWHPKFPLGRPPPSTRTAITGADAQYSVRAKVVSTPIGSRGHAGSY